MLINNKVMNTRSPGTKREGEIEYYILQVNMNLPNNC